MAFEFLKKIFGGAKKSSSKSSELNSLMAQMMKDIFPDGANQMKKELTELASILGVPTSKIRGTFNYACSRAFMGNCDKETLVFGIARHKDGLSDAQVAKFAKFVFAKLLKQRAGLPAGPLLDASLNAMGFTDDNSGYRYDEIPGGTGEFGISINNPVPVNGILANESYLKSLITSDGLSISWTRVGSGGADNIESPIDIYKITDSMGRERPTIYISPYHSSTSKKAPRGYKFK